MYSLRATVPCTLSFLLFTVVIILVESALHEKSCGILYKEQNFTGDILSIKDAQYFSNLGETYMTTDTVWNVTKSFFVEGGCLLTVCNQSYFDGVCQEFTEGVNETPLEFDSLLSVNCTCATECECSDVHMRKTSCARGYVNKGCNTCNAFYTDFKGSKEAVPPVFKESIASIVVRKGCSLTVYDEEDYQGEETTIEGITLEYWNANVSSYECVCSENNDSPIAQTSKPRPDGSPPFIDIPLSADNISALLDTELGDLPGIGKHPGLVAALRSIKVKRSPRNAYILLLGLTGAGKSSAINLLFDNDNVTTVGTAKSTTSDIHEFRIPVPIDHLGIQNSELRIIDTPGLGDTRGLEQDAKFLSTLEDYLDGHEELSNRIPNIVLIFAKFHDNRFDGEGSTFVKMLRGIDSFRERITDKKFSNVIFVLSHFMSETRAIRRRPGVQLRTFKDVIEQYSLFPKPISIIVAENKAAEQELPMLNGYYKLENGDFYPRNLFEKIEFATVNGVDPIGEAVIRSAFSDSDDFNVSSITFPLVTSQHKKVIKYLAELSGAHFNPVNTEVSQILATAYESMDVKIAKKFPDALPYLQRSFNIRNILTKADIPRTTLKIVEFMKDIKQNEATGYLMERAFGLKSPNFAESVITGYGYDIVNDRPLLSSPFKLGELKNTDIGYMIPNVMSCNIESLSKGIFHVYQNKEDYLKKRLQNLNVEDSVPIESFKGEAKPGSNIFNASFNERNESTVSALKEHRLFELVLNDRLSLTPEFVNTVKNLSSLNSSDYDSVENWKKFFNEYGTHVVQSTHGGGSIEIILASNQTFGPEVAQSMFQIIEFAEDVTIGKIKNSSFDKLQTSHTLKFRGGDPKYHATDLRSMSLTEAADVLEKWKESLSLNPAILMSDMRLLPISEVAKKVGKNFAADIQFAAQELFNSSLKFIPPNKRNYVPEDRQVTGQQNNFMQNEFSMIFKEMLENSRLAEERMATMMQQMNEANAEQARLREEERREQAEFARLQAIRKEERDDRNNQIERERQDDAIKRNEANLEKIRKDQEKLAQQQRNHDIHMATLKAETDKVLADKQIELAKAKKTCLKKGTNILMADGSEKKVENIQPGDIILDGRLMPTKVVGMSSDFLFNNQFYGFENDSYFFTGTHLLVGRDTSSGRPRMYAQSTEELFSANPLMEYMYVDDMKGQFEILKYNQSENKMQLDKVSVFQDPNSYSPETFVYFLLVDNPEGTYIANGFVCRHEIPPLEIWSKTIALLFSISYYPDANPIAQLNYTLTSVNMIGEIVEGVYRKLVDVLSMADYVLEDENDKEISLGNVDVEEFVGGIYSNQPLSAFMVRLYGRCGPALADKLDIDVQGKVGTLQKLLLEAAIKEIHLRIQSPEFINLLKT